MLVQRDLFVQSLLSAAEWTHLSSCYMEEQVSHFVSVILSIAVDLPTISSTDKHAHKHQDISVKEWGLQNKKTHLRSLLFFGALTVLASELHPQPAELELLTPEHPTWQEKGRSNHHSADQKWKRLKHWSCYLHQFTLFLFSILVCQERQQSPNRWRKKMKAKATGQIRFCNNRKQQL